MDGGGENVLWDHIIDDIKKHTNDERRTKGKNIFIYAEKSSSTVMSRSLATCL